MGQGAAHYPIFATRGSKQSKHLMASEMLI